ncbi:MAG: ribosomal L7Ae/L30e/S12e/Gadd45 family protein [Bacillota bacterium]|nr:ribosomal L7Ae/L30e/S12e/Gadd45 family protein [Bacillota bacterium]
MINKFLQFLGITKRAGKLVEGYNKCEETVKRGGVFLVILSDESSENTKKKFKNYCEKKDIPCIEGISKDTLGKVLGRTEINVLCVIDVGMSNKLLELWRTTI